MAALRPRGFSSAVWRLRKFAPGATFRMTGAAVNFATAETGGEALPANYMEAVVADVMALCRIEAGFTREGVEGFQYGVVCQRKWPRFLSSFH